MQSYTVDALNAALTRGRTMQAIRLGNKDSLHMYEVEVGAGLMIEVLANSRAHARRVAESAGYAVLSINMVA